jgi:hypothetical protein
MLYRFLCNSTFTLHSHLIKHLNIFHVPKSIDVFKCNKFNYLRIFHSFKNHLNQHKNIQANILLSSNLLLITKPHNISPSEKVIFFLKYNVLLMTLMKVHL